MNKSAVKFVVGAVILLILLAFANRFYISIPAGHVGVATLFGQVQEEPFKEGLHVPVNPLYKWHLYDVRQKTHKEKVSVPSQDQLQTLIEMSVQFRLIGEMTPTVLKETGLYEDVLNVHITPVVRSILREQGKSIKRAEDFFLEETQVNIQTEMLEQLRTYLQAKGIDVQAVLIRDIKLPPFITKAIEAKKEREQEVEKQKAELERFRTEQQQLIAAAEAQKTAAEQEAQKIRQLADAEAYKIEKLNKALANNPAYIKLQSLEALKNISKDPATKIYFINGDSPNPLPLMHIGEK